MTNNKPVKMYTVYLPLDMHTAIKVYAAKRQTSISEIIINALTILLKGDK